MARPALAGLSIAQLQKYVAAKKNEYAELNRERSKLQAKIAKIDAKLAAIGGSSVGGGKPGGRAKNAKSLVATIVELLEKAPKGMGVGDILQGVEDSGYRSTSPNLRSMINQALIKEKKKFSKIDRGVYGLKK